MRGVDSPPQSSQSLSLVDITSTLENPEPPNFDSSSDHGLCEQLHPLARIPLVMLCHCLLFALCAIGVFAHLHQLHHAAIFMCQDVTVLHIEPGKISEAGTHL